MISIPGKIPIRISPFFWLLAIVIGGLSSDFNLLQTALWVVVILFSVLLHEYGHALTALAFGQTARIELVPLGGVTYREGKKLKPWQDFIVVLNGPLVGFLIFILASIAVASLGTPRTINAFTYTLLITQVANLYWTILNLIPVHPLDGGRLLSIVLEGLFGVRGFRFSFLLSSLIGVAIGILFFIEGNLLAGSLFLMLAFEGYRSWESSQHMAPQDQDTALQQSLKGAEESIKQGKVEDAQARLIQLRNETKEGMLYVTATEDLASLLFKKGSVKEAYEMLKPLHDHLSLEALQLLHYLASLNQDWQETIKLGNAAYQANPNYKTALANAVAHAMLQEERPAIGWLQRAIDDGLPNIKQTLSKPEFDHLRLNPAFRALE